MATPQPVQPQQGTGLPPGVEMGPLGARVVAYLVDLVVPGILALLISLALPGMSGVTRSVLTFVLVVLLVGWVLLVWRMIAVQAASPGMRLVKLQVVGFYNGRPIGWARAFLRGLVLAVLSATGIGLVLLLVFLLLHPRRQGWHDLVAKAVVIKQRGLPPSAKSAAAQPAVASSPDQQDQPVAGYGAGEVPQVAQTPRSPAYEVDGPRTPASPSAVPGGAVAFDPSGLTPLTGVATPEPVVRPPSSPGSAPPSVSGLPAPVVRPAPAPAPVQPWIAELDDGREIVVEGLVLLGRNPQPQPGEEDAQLIKLADETRTVSKSHLAVGLDAAGLYVVDRGSTNGSTVTTPAGVSSRVRAGEIVYLDPESVVSIGDHWLRIRRASA